MVLALFLYLGHLKNSMMMMMMKWAPEWAPAVNKRSADLICKVAVAMHKLGS